MEESIRRKTEQRKNQMERLQQYLCNKNICTEEQIKFVTEQTPSVLLDKLKCGEISAVEVLNAFQFKAIQVTKKINCITEFIPEAQEWAERCDMIPVDDRKRLHGVPVSIKDSISVKGMDSTLGLAKHLYDPASKHSIIVEILLENGAVPFCKTNVPQAQLSFCCSNPVYGKTVNPHDPSRTPGGSSGGEAALIASGGSIVGIGSDLAGSARVPASMSGCFGLQLTTHRLSSMGFRRGAKGLHGISSCPGILGRDSYIISLVAQVLIESHELNLDDASIVPLPWNESIITTHKKLTFGYFNDTSFFPCTPGVKRAVDEAKEALEKLGHKVVSFDMIDPETIVKEAIKILTADKGQLLRNHLRKESIDPSLKLSLMIALATGLKKKILVAFTSLQSPFLSRIINSSCHDVVELWECFHKRKSIIQDIKDRMKKDQIDLLLCPVYPMPAPQHFIPSLTLPACFYTIFTNYCDLPSCSIPVTKETENDQLLLDDYPTTDHLLQLTKDATRGSIGLPIGVSLTGLFLREELLLKGVKELERALQS